ncbi:isoprenylcysteine carboxylmethyltransferase family protein [Arthrobacter sp. AQ5-06]|nr:isoprenylcysteine carboxylmethyltransferase family protein [Arthrobacter sp. AQ5-06]
MNSPPDWGRLLSNIPLPEQNLASIAAGVALQRLMPLRLGGPHLLVRTIGAASLVAGGATVTWAWLAARNTRLARPDALVTAGPYALSRNPMYVGWALAHLGVGLLRDDAWMVAALPVASGAVHRGVLREEEVLAAWFPAEFSQDRLSVPRYVPRLRLGWRAGRPLHPRR